MDYNELSNLLIDELNLNPNIFDLSNESMFQAREEFEQFKGNNINGLYKKAESLPSRWRKVILKLKEDDFNTLLNTINAHQNDLGLPPLPINEEEEYILNSNDDTFLTLLVYKRNEYNDVFFYVDIANHINNYRGV